MDTFDALRRALTGRREVESHASGGQSPAEPSAAQNGTVIQTCRQCGALHGADATSCDVCRALLPQNGSGRGVRESGVRETDEVSSGVTLARKPSANAVGPAVSSADWRGEVSQRLHAYRKRQQRLREGVSQPELAFVEADDSSPASDWAPHRDVPIVTAEILAPAAIATPVETAVATYAPPAPGPRRVRSVPEPLPVRRSVVRPRNERIEIDLLQPSLDFDRSGSAAADFGKNGRNDIARDGFDDLGGGARSARIERGSAHVALASPNASLQARGLAVMLDAALLLTAYSSFLGLFWVLGGRLMISKVDAAVVAATLSLFYAQYFTLFTFFGGATPGMMWRGLQLTRFDGGELHVSDRFWRSVGYLVSAATLLLGFMWALWDEDRLCWHDRISHTHLTRTDAVQQQAASQQQSTTSATADGHSNAASNEVSKRASGEIDSNDIIKPQPLRWRRSI